jgi:hypothetical protein
VIRRRHARVRTVYNAAEHWLILLARYQPRNGITTDGVDAFTFREVEGDWPLGDKWEGDSTVDVYSLAGQSGGNAGIAFRTPQGIVQLFGRDQRQFIDPTAASVLGYRGSNRSTTPQDRSTRSNG